MTAILGISAFYHDSAAALVVDGDIVAAAQEERFTREKNDADFPIHAIDYCLKEAGLAAADLSYVAFYDKPVAKFGRLLETYVAFAPGGFRSFSRAMPVWLKQKLGMRRLIKKGLTVGAAVPNAVPIVFLSHHESHAASAFYPSPFASAAILTVDGVGEWSTAAFGKGEGNRIELTQHLQFPHSLGLLYSAFTDYCGFKINGGEYKLMGLASYGRPAYENTIYQNLIDLKADGSFRLNQEFFNYCQGLTMTNDRFHALFGGPPRKPDARLNERHTDLAASVQAVTEEIILRMGRTVHRHTGMKNLVLAGGVALNCVANGRLLREGPFENIWTQPAAGDSGGALGAALFVWHQLLEKSRAPVLPDAQKASFLGPGSSASAIERFLTNAGAVYHRFTSEDEMLNSVVTALEEEKVVGWFQERAEFGPRALGARSILGDPRSAKIQTKINLNIKFREGFRPFAPSVLREHVHEWFSMRQGEDSAYMLQVASVLEHRRVPLSPDAEEVAKNDPDLARRLSLIRSTIPAVTHVDFSARVQTVDERHGVFYRLLRRFYEKTNCPILVNTSFNLSWEPIVLTPQDGYHAFMQSEMDVLVLGNYVLYKPEQPLGMRLWGEPQKAGSPRISNFEIQDPDSPWADPVTREPLVVTPDGAHNPASGASYPVIDGVPSLFAPQAVDANFQGVTDTVRRFYERTPFPNYDDLDNPRALLEKAHQSQFARLLSEQIPYNARILDMGCGTGQLSNFLASAHRTVLGVDVCLNSLRLGQNFKMKHGLSRASFAQMNLFRPALKDDFFDVVISNGVLHHTGDCRGAFRRLGRLTRPGGYLIVGLYNSYSRKFFHYPRVALYRLTGLTSRWLDPHFGGMHDAKKREAWFQDQYCHPVETCHTLSEVLGWMQEDGLDFVNSIPKPIPGLALARREKLFESRDPGTRFSRVLSQIGNIRSGYREGGLFIMIGRRRPWAAGPWGID